MSISGRSEASAGSDDRRPDSEDLREAEGGGSRRQQGLEKGKPLDSPIDSLKTNERKEQEEIHRLDHTLCKQKR